MSDEETTISNADLGMHYGDLPFENGQYEKFDDMMQRFARTFGCAETDDNGYVTYDVWREFCDEDRNANLTQHGEYNEQR